MRFIDSNIFLHAFLITRRSLTIREQKVKEEAKSIIKRIEENEKAEVTTAHLSEIVNIVEVGLSLQKSLSPSMDDDCREHKNLSHNERRLQGSQVYSQRKECKRKWRPSIHMHQGQRYGANILLQ